MTAQEEARGELTFTRGPDGVFTMIVDGRAGDGNAIASRILEEAIAGSLIVSVNELLPVCRAEGLCPDDLFHHHCRLIFDAACRRTDSGEPVDAVAIAELLKHDGTFDDVGGMPGLIGLAESAQTEMGLRDSVRRVKRFAIKRGLVDRLEGILSSARDPDLSANDLRAELWELTRVPDRGGIERFPSMTAAELDAGSFELQYLVDGMLVEGQPAIVAAGKKQLKTNIGIDLALSIASGFPFLGKFRILKTARVAFISGESGAATIQETARRIARSKGQPLRSFDGVRFCFDLPALSSGADLAALESFLDQHSTEVLFVDPLYLCLDDLGDGASNLFSVGRVMKPLLKMTARLGITLVIVHHTRKGATLARGRVDPYAPPELEDIAWAGFQEITRQWLLLNRREAYDPESAGEHRLWLNVGGSAGHSGLWALDITEGRRIDDGGRRWDVVVQNASQARAEAIEEAERRKDEKAVQLEQRDRERILTTLESFPNGETKSAIRNAAKLNSRRFAPIFDSLIESGEISAVEVSKNGRLEQGFKRGRTRSDSVGQIDGCPGIGRSGRLPPPLGGGLSVRPTDHETTHSAVGQVSPSGPTARANGSTPNGQPPPPS